MTSLIALAHPVLLAATKTTKTSGGSSLFLVFLVVIAVAGYFLFLRPQQQKARKQRSLQSDIQEGDEVVTVGGIVGRVLKMEDDRVHLVTGHHPTPELGDNLPHRMTFVRNAIARKIETPVHPESADDFQFEHEDGGDTDDGYSVNGYSGSGHVDNGHAEPAFDPELDLPPAHNGYVANGRMDGLTTEGAPDAADDAAPSAGADQAPRRRSRGRRSQGGTKEGTTP